MKKKTILNLIFLAVCLLLTAYYVFRDQNLKELLACLKQGRPVYWAAGVILVIVFILSESVIIFYLLKSLKQEVRLNHCFLYSFAGFFFSLVTPSASGGQPAQVVFMKKDGLPIHLSSLVLLIVTITYKLVLVIFGLAVLILRPAREMAFLQPAIGWIWLGIALNVLCVGGMLALVFCPGLTHRLVLLCLHLLRPILGESRIAVMEQKLEHVMESYGKASGFFAVHRSVIFNVLIITFLQRCFLFAVPYLVLLSFGFDGIGLTEVIVLQAMISVAVDMLPLPGGMGISEHLFRIIFLPVCGAALTTPALLVSRGISYYTQLFISMLFTISAYFIIFRRKEQ
ncbi:MAG: YbhN family protein [Emergencia sp.]